MRKRKLFGDAGLFQRGGIAAHDAGVHAELRLGELRAGLHLGEEPVRLPAVRRIDRHVGGANEERGLAVDLAAGGQRALVAQAARGFHQGPRIDVEDRLGLGLIA